MKGKKENSKSESTFLHLPPGTFYQMMPSMSGLGVNAKAYVGKKIKTGMSKSREGTKSKSKDMQAFKRMFKPLFDRFISTQIELWDLYCLVQ